MARKFLEKIFRGLSEGSQAFPAEFTCSFFIGFGCGDQIMVSTEAEAVRFLLVSGAPIGETVAWYGPIVMNT